MRYPILGTGETIPWEVIAPHEKQAQINHYQTLTRIAERGGLSWSEALAVLEDRQFEQIDEIVAKDMVIKIVSKFNNQN